MHTAWHSRSGVGSGRHITSTGSVPVQPALLCGLAYQGFSLNRRFQNVVEDRGEQLK